METPSAAIFTLVVGEFELLAEIPSSQLKFGWLMV